MKLYQLDPSGELTQDMIRDYGDSYSIQERIVNKNYGLGHLKLKDGYSAILAFYEQENNSIKTHFEWTKKGCVIRMRTMQKLYAIGLKDEEIESISLTKRPDYIYAVPLFPFWILLKVGIRISIAKWFRLKGDKIIYGSGLIQLRLSADQTLTYELDGTLWKDCLSTFKIDKIKDRLRILDERSGNKTQLSHF